MLEQRDDDQPNVAGSLMSDKVAAAGPFSAREAADLLGVHERTIRRAIRDGRLVAARPGRAYQVSSAALHRYWDAHREQPHRRSASSRPILRLLPLPMVATDERAGSVSWFGDGAAGLIPRPLTSFVGRANEIKTIAQLVGGGARLVTLTGPGGVGKTRLAIAAALALGPEFEDGAVFVPLAPIGDPALVPSAIARALDVRDVPGRPILEVLAAMLRERRVLLVLDNVEHVRPAGVDVARLLEACPRVVALATSREPLRVSGEQRFPTLPLALPDGRERAAPEAAGTFDAIRLFVERARLVDHTFILTEANVAPVVDICRRLDGLPLAIELAAAWVRMLPPEALLGQLERRLAVLHGGGEDQPARLRTMSSAIAWSADLLSADEARLFRRLGIFVGGFTLDAVEWVVGAGWQGRGTGGGVSRAVSVTRRPPPGALALLAALVDKSLVQPAPMAGGEPRFAMLETVREYARDRLAASGEEQTIAAAQAAFVRDLAERAEPELLGPDERHWQARIETELGNVRAALIWSLEYDIETALRIAAALWISWSVDHIAEGRRWLAAALEHPATVSEAVRARAMTTEAALGAILGDVAASEGSAIAAADLAATAGDRLWESRARWVIGANRLTGGQIAGVADTLDRSLALFADATTASGRAHAAFAGWNRGMLALMAGETDAGFAAFDRALVQARASASPTIITFLLGDYAGWLVGLGDTARARRLLDDALPLVARNPMNHPGWLALLSLAMITAAEGNAEAAARLLGAIVTALDRTGAMNPPLFQARVDQTIALAKDALGETAFVAAWEAGRGDLEGVIAAAIRSASDQNVDGETPRQPLTPREVEVLRLVVAGQADKEIAATLAISRATASRHVGSIRAKLGAPSRSAVAAIAVRDQLA